ncbi:MAG: glycosyltransferase family 87 protein [Gemmataceae bacterium]|nr:DUF2029 domain-containing protein [Gemmata sp.]MDW8198799.1 glycosyltransferase family 87 protein [Gemmataceae bacterium]
MPPATTTWPPARIIVWGVVAVVVGVWFGPRFILAFRPAENYYFDFLQEWLSARNYLAGTPVYAEQTQAMLRHTGVLLKEGMGMILSWNAHPPASVMIALPFGHLPYRDAHFLWNVVTFPLFLISIVIILWELKFPLSPWSLLPALSLLLLFHPLYLQLFLGQLNILLVFFITLAWWADRHDRIGWAGVAVGIAAGLKLYPAFLLAYFFCTRRWRGLATGVATFLAVNGLALAVFGIATFRTYIDVVVPSLQKYQTSGWNISITAFWLRIFDPHPAQKIITWSTQPEAARLLIWLSRLVITAVVVWVAWRSYSVATRDRAFATAIVGMLLVSPITWSHYFILLLLPAALLWLRWPSGSLRILLWLVLIPLWMPDYFFVALAVGPSQAQAMVNMQHDPIKPVVNITFFAVLTYALVALFVLTVICPAHDSPHATDSPPRATTNPADSEPPNGAL